MKVSDEEKSCVGMILIEMRQDEGSCYQWVTITSKIQLLEIHHLEHISLYFFHFSPPPSCLNIPSPLQKQYSFWVVLPSNEHLLCHAISGTNNTIHVPNWQRAPFLKCFPMDPHQSYNCFEKDRKIDIDSYVRFYEIASCLYVD